MIELYTYWRSSAAYRVRIGLAIKQLDYISIPTHLLDKGGEHLTPQYAEINPQQLLPTLAVEANYKLTQSVAILEYLEEVYPEYPLLPKNPIERAQARAVAHAIAMEIHPLNNLRVLKYLQKQLNVTEQQRNNWYEHWVSVGFEAIEHQLSRQEHCSQYCFGAAPSLADVCLVPQVYNALRFTINISQYPNISRIYDNCMALDAFAIAAPNAQLDAGI